MSIPPPLTPDDDPWRRGPASPLAWSLWLYFRHPVLWSLAALAAIGRAVQLGWAAEHSTMTYALLELVVEPARLLLAVAVIGAGSLRRGLRTLKTFWTRSRTGANKLKSVDDPGAPAMPSWQRLRALSGRLLGALLAMAAFALLGNWCIDQAAETRSVRDTMQLALGANASAATDAARFFLKNLTVIPIVIIWYGGMYRMLRPHPR